VVTRDVDQFVEAGVPAFDPWSGVLHAAGAQIVLKAPTTIDAVAQALSDERSD
jgi:hypothetical protein